MVRAGLAQKEKQNHHEATKDVKTAELFVIFVTSW